MNLEIWLHLLHIVGAVIWVGGGVMLSVIGARARRSENPQIIGDFAQMLSYTGPRVLMPAVLAVIITGVWLVLASPGWSFTQLWVILALVAFAVAFLVGAVYLSRIALELSRFLIPPAVADHRNAPVNALGYLRVMFTVDDVDETLARLGKLGAKLVGEVVQYEDSYKLCYIRGPEGLLIGLAEQLG